MAVFTLPKFNMLCDYYTAATPPPAGPPARTNLAFQYYNPPRQQGQNTGSRTFRFPISANPYGTLFLFNDILVVTSNWGPNYGGIGFLIAEALIQHSGFPNEYWAIDAYPIDITQLPAIAFAPIV